MSDTNDPETRLDDATRQLADIHRRVEELQRIAAQHHPDHKGAP